MDKNVIHTASLIKYVVDLRDGKVTPIVSDYSNYDIGPYKICNNVIQADLYSLNILRQNVREKTFVAEGIEPEMMTRNFLDCTQVIPTVSIIPTMKWLSDTFPEKMI